MLKSGHTVNDAFTEFSTYEMKLRAKLVREEVVDELLPALDDLLALAKQLNKTTPLVEDHEDVKEVYVNLMDAVADSVYVILGIPVALGVDGETYFDEAHRS